MPTSAKKHAPPSSQAAQPPAWDESTLQAPHEEQDKAARVNQMFSAIAESYDLNNRVHSLWQDQAWRRKAVRLARVKPDQDTVVDVACGTGDLSFAFAQANPSKVVGIDFVSKMIDVANLKADRLQDEYQAADFPLPDFRVGDAMELDVPNEFANVVSIAFGIRNVTDPSQALCEFRRILQPGGRVIILEFSLPRNLLLRAGYNFYFNHIMPRTATLLSRDRSGAYKYLPRSVNTFIERDAMVSRMEDAGFINVTQHPMTFGICIGYLGHVAGGSIS